MKKLLLLVLVSVLLFAICFISEAEDYSTWVTETMIGNPNAEITLTAWLGRDETLATPHENLKAFYKETFLGWAKRHPEVKVEIQVIDTGEIAAGQTKLFLAAERGNPPDIAWIETSWVKRFMDLGYLQPIDQFLTEQEQMDFFDLTKQFTMSNGKQYALYTEADARMLYYRKDWIEKPPRTWDELIETALKMKKERGVHGFLAKYTAEGATNEMTWPFFWAQGGEIFDKEGKPIFGEGKNREYMLNILKFDKKLIDSGAMPVMCASWTSFDPLLAEVKADNVAMFIEGSWCFTQIEGLIGKEEAHKKYGVAPFPQMKADQRSNSICGRLRGVFSQEPVKQRLAFSYIWENLVSKDIMAERCMIGGYIPTRKSVLENYYFFKADDFQQFLGEEMKTGGVRPGDVLYPDVSEAVSTSIEKLLTGRLEPEQALDEAYAQSLKAWERKKK